jgi:nicotinamidase-related amidase
MSATIDPGRSLLLLVDFQERLHPAIAAAEETVREAARVRAAARLLGIPVAYTEQNPGRLGPTVDALSPGDGEAVLAKQTFDASRADGFGTILGDSEDVVVCGWEAHVCVLQTVLGLTAAGRRAFVLADAVGSRRPESRDAGLSRMLRNGAEIVTAEMVIFEWLGAADNPRFREVLALVR